jgi:hypothetical protein
MQGHRRLAEGRPDAIPNDAGDFADLKTTTSVQTADLARTIAEYGYHQQAALIAAGWHAITGKDIASFSFVFIESKPPFCTRIVTLKDDDLARGERQNFVAIKTFAKCMAIRRMARPRRRRRRISRAPDMGADPHRQPA